MTAPSFIRYWRTRLSDAQVNRVRIQLAAAQARNRALEQRLADLQAANEGAYRELFAHTGGPRFAPDQPFGRAPADSARTSAGA
ncbi:hypothetical protein ME763_31980 [Streptomyces murinus]|uniref:hypothetical protein n=1 Tax=Streptomyces murinus TaxID=33900 RepID=UPI000A200FCF|nr:hypothetical protein [Streptomyces murinus]WDO09911.1 hypothetical protein ME763_31980 [Streptomyces murinus]